jgi:manganese/zinc/iron transport system permease protein
MSTDHLFILLIAMGTAAACAIPGVFLILKRKALMSDAIGHAVLPGIVIAFLFVQDINSPFLIIGAALTGILTAFLCEWISKTGIVKEDAAIVIVFPFLFSIGVILISRYINNVHLCEDSVLYGNIAFVSFNGLQVFGQSIGPKALYIVGGLLALNIVFVSFFFKELKLSTFDHTFATIAGFSPTLLGYGLTFMVSITAVGAFNIVGSILIIALMIIPPTTAYLLTDDLMEMIVYSVIVGMISGVGGFLTAMIWDTSISGAMAVVAGVCLILAFLFAPKRGMVVRRRRAFS